MYVTCCVIQPCKTELHFGIDCIYSISYHLIIAFRNFTEYIYILPNIYIYFRIYSCWILAAVFLSVGTTAITAVIMGRYLMRDRVQSVNAYEPTKQKRRKVTITIVTLSSVFCVATTACTVLMLLEVHDSTRLVTKCHYF